MNSFDLGVNYQLHKKALLASASHILGNKEWAEDILNDTFVYLLEEPQDYDPEKSAPLTWLANIVNRRCINALRDRNVDSARQRKALVEEEPLHAPSAEEALVGLEKVIEKATFIVRLNEWLEWDTRTPLVVRQAIRAVHMEGDDVEPIARYLGISRHTLVRQMDAALLRWRKRLEREAV